MAFDLYVNAGLGTQNIAYTLNSLGARPHRSEQFSRTSIVAMLRNKVYIGKVVYNRKSTVKKNIKEGEKLITVYNDPSEWIVADGLHPPIIDDETFELANKILSSRYHKPYNDGSVLNPLAGLLICRKCGRSMQRRPFSAKKNTTVHLLCQTKGCCKSSRLDYVEEAVLNSVSKKLNELRELSAVPKKKVDYTSAIKELEREQRQLKNQKSRLYDLLERGVYDIDTFTERSQNITSRLNSLQKECESLARQQAAASSNLKNVIRKYENVLKLYNHSTPAQKNRLLKTVIKSGTYYKAKDWSPKQFALQLNFIDF